MKKRALLLLAALTMSVSLAACGDRSSEETAQENVAGESTVVETVKLLLKAGANVDAADEDGDTALTLAACNGHVEMVKLLLKAGANVDA